MGAICKISGIYVTLMGKYPELHNKLSITDYSITEAVIGLFFNL